MGGLLVMYNKSKMIVFILCCFYISSAHAVDVTGKVATSTNISQTEAGQLGYSGSGDAHETINTNQQSFRLMLQESEVSQFEGISWLIHGKFYRQNVSALSAPVNYASENFRYEMLSNTDDLAAPGDKDELYIYELDIATLSYHYGKADVNLGRQAVDWGTGRFWQPMNVFGAFAPTDLDTDYKAGIDSVQLNYYPSAFSSVDIVVAFSPKDDPDYHESYAAYYRRQVEGLGEVSVLVGEVLNNQVGGLSLESEWQGMGVRVEGVHYQLDQGFPQDSAYFWIAGVDYLFSNDTFVNGTLLTLEYYHNAFGASSESDLPAQLSNPLVITGIQSYMSEQMLGLSLNKDLNPLLNVNYSLLTSELEGSDNKKHSTFLHQLNFSYSLSDEADMLFSLLTTNGKKANLLSLPQSEFGHVPESLSMRLRYFF